MFNFIDIYNFILVSICVGMGTSALLCPGAYNAVKTVMVWFSLFKILLHELCRGSCKGTIAVRFAFQIVQRVQERL
jgi:hypothetical protein